MADYFASIFGTEKDKGDGKEISDAENQKHFDEFFEDIYVELEEKFGPIEEMNVCDNLGDHLTGNVYVKFKKEEDAEKAVEELNNRWFSGKPVYAELSTVTDFREAGCRKYELGACTRGGFCNFMHLKQISKDLRHHLLRDVDRRSVSPTRARSRTRSRSISPAPRHKSHRPSYARKSSRSHRSPPSPRRRRSGRSRSRSRSLTPSRPYRSRSRSPRSLSRSPVRSRSHRSSKGEKSSRRRK